MRKPTLRAATILGVLLGCLAACRLFNQKPEPQGLSKIKSVGKASDTWKDSANATWVLVEGRKMTWKNAHAYCGRLSRLSGERWRLPSPEELREARAGGIGGLDNKAFGWVRLGNTWAADWEANLEEKLSGTYVDMDEGQVYRAVSDELEHTTVCFKPNSTANFWNDGRGRRWWYIPKLMRWEVADVTCQELARRVHQPWRLPSPDELRIAIRSGIQARQNKAFGRDYITYVWSSRIAAILESDEAYAIDLRNGHNRLTSIGEDLAVVCVMREEPSPPKDPAKTPTP